MWALLTSLLLAAPTPQAPPDPCDPALLRPYYAPLEDSVQLARTSIETLPDVCSNASRQPSSNGTFYLVVCSRSDDHRVVLGDSEHLLQLRVDEAPWRPLRANWINEKLVYLEFSWNPRAGAYWIFDVDRQKIVLAERSLQDVLDLQRCYGSESVTPHEHDSGSSPDPSDHLPGSPLR